MIGIFYMYPPSIRTEFFNKEVSTIISNSFKSDNSNMLRHSIAKIMATITNMILKFKPMVKKPKVTNHAFFTLITFSWIISFTYINSIVIHPFIKIKKLTFISLKKFIIKIVYYLRVCNFIISIVWIYLKVIFDFINK